MGQNFEIGWLKSLLKIVPAASRLIEPNQGWVVGGVKNTAHRALYFFVSLRETGVVIVFLLTYLPTHLLTYFALGLLIEECLEGGEFWFWDFVQVDPFPFGAFVWFTNYWFS